MEFRYEIISLCSALFVWLMIFGLIGVFRTFFSGESLKIRFVSDSAYWLYIAHLPLIQVLQIWVSEWPISSVFKLVFVCLSRPPCCFCPTAISSATPQSEPCSMAR